MKVRYVEEGRVRTETHNNVEEAVVDGDSNVLHIIGLYGKDRYYNFDKVVWFGQ